MIYHVLLGDSLVAEFKKANIAGEVIVCSESCKKFSRVAYFELESFCYDCHRTHKATRPFFDAQRA